MTTFPDDWRHREASQAGRRELIWGGRYRVCVPWSVERRDLQRLVRATELWESGRCGDALALWQELRTQPVEPRFGR